MWVNRRRGRRVRGRRRRPAKPGRGGLRPLGLVRAAAAAHERLGRVHREHQPRAICRRRTSTTGSRNRSTLTPAEPDPDPASLVEHTGRNESGAVGITAGHRAQYGPSGEDIEWDGEHENIPESDEGDPSGERGRSTTIRGTETGWLITTVSCDEPAYPMCHIGLARGAAPSTPGPRYGASPRRFRPAIKWSSPGRSRGGSMCAGWSPAAGGARSAPAVKLLRSSFADASALRVTAAADRAGWLLGASRKGWPSFTTDKNAPLRYLGEPDPLLACPAVDVLTRRPSRAPSLFIRHGH